MGVSKRSELERYYSISESFSKFIEHYLRDYDQHQLGGDFRGVKTEFYMKFKELTSMIDYDCRFENGLCKRERSKRHTLFSGSKPSTKCCCQGCNQNLGFLSYISDIKSARKIWELYTPVHGFWSPKGCKLPRSLRSSTCLNHSCGGEWSESREWLYDILSYGLEDIDEYNLQYIDNKDNRGAYGSYCKAEAVYNHLKKILFHEYNIRITNQIKMNEFEQMGFRVGW